MKLFAAKRYLLFNPQNFNVVNSYVFIICFLLPLVFWNRLQDVDNTPKLLTLSLFLSAFSVYFLLARRKADWHILRQYFKHPVYITCLLFLLFNFLSLANAINFTDGLFPCLNFLLAFVHLNFLMLLLHTCESPVGTVALGITCIAFVLVCIGISQVVTMYFRATQNIIFQFNYFISSSLGNKNTFTECLLICLPFSIISYITFKGIKKYFALLVLALSFVLIILLQTFSVWLSFGLVVLCALAGLLFFSGFKKLLLGESKLTFLFKPIPVIVSILLLAGIVTFFVFSNTFQIGNKINQVVQLFKPENNLDDFANINSITERSVLWSASAKMIKENLLTGVGLSNWKIYFPQFNSSGSMLFSTGSIKFQYPHNDYILVAAENGIAGGLLLMALFAVPLIMLVKAIKNCDTKIEKKNLLLVLASILFIASVSFFGYTMQRMFCIFLFFTILSLVLVVTQKKQKVIPLNTKSYFFIFLFVAVFISGYTVNASLSRLNSEYYLGRTIIQQGTKNYPRMLKESEKIKTDYFQIDALTTPIEWYKASALFLNGDVIKAKEKYLAAEKNNPNHLQVLTDIGTCYDKTGNPDSAIYYYKRALQLQPKFIQAVYNLSAVYNNDGKLINAYALLKTISPQEGTTIKYGQYIKAILTGVRDSVISADKTIVSDSILKQQLDVNYLLHLDSITTSEKTIQQLIHEYILKYN